MAHLIFRNDGSKSSLSFLNCPIHRGKDGVICLDVDGYLFYLPQAKHFVDVVEHLITLQESFERGIYLHGNVSPSGNDDFLLYDPKKDILDF